ncbi:hypothetical protein HK405_001545, partial [Cladochytrium tenue]
MQSALFPDGLSLQSCVFGECGSTDLNTTLTVVNSARGLSFGETMGLGAASFVVLLAVAGATISFTDVGYSIQNGRLILNNITGSAPAGKVFAIMGPSGAGKSTFLDIISGKSKRGMVSGSISVDGQAAQLATVKELVGYVDQEDLLMPTLTVREALEFSASLRLPESVGASERRARVNDVMEALGLSHVADTRIGGFGKRGISGGEKRRVSIGIELVTSPPVLVLDEPTSGLDSFNAFSVIKTLAKLAHDQGKTVIFTIHQPRSDVFALFDVVLLLSGGTAIYCGPGADAAGYFKSRDSPCPEGYNIADHLLDLATAVGSPEYLSRSCLSIAQSRSRRPWQQFRARKGIGQILPDGMEKGLHSEKREASQIFAYTGQGNSRDAHKSTIVTVRGTSQDSLLDDHSNKIITGEFDRANNRARRQMRPGFLTQLSVLMGRAFRNLYRTPSLLLGHIIMAVGLGALIGGFYYHSDNSLAGVQNRLGSLMFILALIGFSGLSGIGSFSVERQIFIRERSNHFYSSFPYYITKVIFDIIPLRILPAIILGAIAFFMIGFTSGTDHFTKYMAILILFAAEIGLLCLFFAIIISDVGSATLYGSIVILFKMLLGGLLINQAQIVPALGWIQYLSFYRYAYEALVVNDLTNMNIVDTVSGATINIPASVVLSKFGFDINKYWQDLLVSSGIVIGLLVANGIFIHLILKERRAEEDRRRDPLSEDSSESEESDTPPSSSYAESEFTDHEDYLVPILESDSPSVKRGKAVEMFLAAANRFGNSDALMLLGEMHL